jgi:galactokinase/mevalonate kinase-like predicted kinase
MSRSCQYILSLPRACAARFSELDFRVPPGSVVTHDPPAAPLGSGGGLVHALAAAWRESGEADFTAWLGQGVRVVVHAGGESRRTPAYAAEGKAFTPIPVLRWSFGQRFDQTLLDLQMPFIESAVAAAPAGTAAAVCSGDVLLQGSLPARLPEADVICLGMWTGPETASRHGVFFCDRAAPERLLCMLQKPAPAEIKALSQEALFLVDTGLWLFSARAVRDLMAAGGWTGAGFAGGAAAALDLYGGVGAGLGVAPRTPHPVWSRWSCAVIPVGSGDFYHFGTSRELVETTLRLQNARLDQRHFGRGVAEHPATFIQNAQVGVGLSAANHTVWIENSFIPADWTLAQGHVLTGIPENTWGLRLPAGVCLDLVPVGDAAWAVRFYGLDDAFRGALAEPGTTWLGKPLQDWFGKRGLTLAECGLEAGTDIQRAALFPVLSAEQLSGGFVQWLLGEAEEPRESLRSVAALINHPVAATASGPAGGPGSDVPVDDYSRVYRDAVRRSASDLATAADLVRRGRQREVLRQRALTRLAETPTRSVFLRTDLGATAATFARAGLPLPPAERVGSPLDALHLHMFRAAVRRQRDEAEWRTDEHAAFAALRQVLLSPGELTPAAPQRRLLADQIIWGRSPVRIDLAGGWTDTPPYCMVHGGRVVNLAIELNGQPPIQVFGRCSDEPGIVIRSIDLGQQQHLSTYDELRGFAEVGSAFSIPRAALALAGFLPEFAARPAATLRQALERFGGGIELTLLAAVPKGSGLGTSSILAATVLGTLNDLCGLGWHRDEIIRRTLCLEQMLTTGGGWQDQAGGIWPGLKLLESAPGSPQVIQVRWLPDALLRQHANRTVLLYYTGITRVAKDILQEVVRGMFLNSAGTLRLLGQIGEHALRAADAIQRQNLADLGGVLRRSWELNCALDAGTNPPAIRELLGRVEPWLEGAKLLGAGGGGYLVMVARDADAADRIRQEFALRPPHPAARFVEMTLSDVGLQVTRS